MSKSQAELNENYRRKLTEAASKSLIEKMKRLESITDFCRDDSFLGNMAHEHMMYKLDTLYSEDGHRAYEFLVEYHVEEPTVGIYYGCKGLILCDNDDHEIAIFNEEWNQIMTEVLYILNNTFPDKDYTHRFKPTDNANDKTYWPFWISLYEDEDIIEVAARATKIIRNVYQKYLEGKLKTVHRPSPKEIKTVTAFTLNAYNDFIESLKTDDNFKSFQQFHKFLLQKKYIEQNDIYEKCWIVKNMSNVEFAFLWAAFCKHIELIKDEDVVPWQHITKIFMNKNGEPFKDNLKKQYSNPTITDYKDIHDNNKITRMNDAQEIINEIFRASN